MNNVNCPFLIRRTQWKLALISAASRGNRVPPPSPAADLHKRQAIQTRSYPSLITKYLCTGCQVQSRFFDRHLWWRRESLAFSQFASLIWASGATEVMILRRDVALIDLEKQRSLKVGQ